MLKQMNSADGYAMDKHHQSKQLIAISRQVVQTAEDARTIAVKKMDEARRDDERSDSANALAQSQAQTGEATRGQGVCEAKLRGCPIRCSKVSRGICTSKARHGREPDRLGSCSSKRPGRRVNCEQNCTAGSSRQRKHACSTRARSFGLSEYARRIAGTSR